MSTGLPGKDDGFRKSEQPSCGWKPRPSVEAEALAQAGQAQAEGVAHSWGA